MVPELARLGSGSRGNRPAASGGFCMVLELQDEHCDYAQERKGVILGLFWVGVLGKVSEIFTRLPFSNFSSTNCDSLFVTKGSVMD